MQQSAHERNTAVRLLLTVDEAAQALGIGRALTYRLVMGGQIASVKIGRARRIPTAALNQFIANRLADEV